MSKHLFALAAALVLASAPVHAKPVKPAPDPAGDDIVHGWKAPRDADDYIERSVMIPMRDGVKLRTIIMIPKGAKNAPIIFTRTPYDATARARRIPGAKLSGRLPMSDEDVVLGGYIRVYQDVRGKYGSEGTYVLARPPRGPLNTGPTDHVTDAWDSIDWLVKNTPESNGKVGMIGSSYGGFTVSMALLDPHPALKAAVPESPQIDGWMGDDWFHYGAFCQPTFDYVKQQTAQTGAGSGVERPGLDDYTTFLRAGSAGDYARANNIDKMPAIAKVMAHPTYDGYWQGQAMEPMLVKANSKIPTLWEQGLWDQEDLWGANHAYDALKQAGQESNNWLVMGPWFHSQIALEGWNLGPLRWSADTTKEFRRDMIAPFFDHYLKGAPDPKLPRATLGLLAEVEVAVGRGRQRRHPAWARRGANAPSVAPGVELGLQAGDLAFDHAQGVRAGATSAPAGFRPWPG
jgi:putative CocE/NonD family hydrolase